MLWHGAYLHGYKGASHGVGGVLVDLSHADTGADPEDEPQAEDEVKQRSQLFASHVQAQRQNKDESTQDASCKHASK